MTKIRTRKYRGRDSVVLSTEDLEAVFFTEFGAKLVSLRNLRNGYEFLWQGKEERHPDAEYGALYTDNDLCGADDIFPSINECSYPESPWKGTVCPPHGELWSQPWSFEIVDSSVVFLCHGVRFPYEIERRVAYESSTVLVFEYTITNRSPYPMPGIWAYHPLWNAGDDTAIVLPKGTDQIVCTLDSENRLGRIGSTHAWPVTIDKCGDSYDLSRFESDCGVCEKFFVDGPLTEGRCRLVREGPGRSIEMRFPTDVVGYLGIWKNQGGLLDQNNIAIEPATGSFDDVSIAHKIGRCSVLPPNGTWRFRLEFHIE